MGRFGGDYGERALMERPDRFSRRRALAVATLAASLLSLLIPAAVALTSDAPIMACCCSRLGHSGPCCCVHGLCVANQNNGAHVRDLLTPPGALVFSEEATEPHSSNDALPRLDSALSVLSREPLSPPPRAAVRV